MKLTQKEKIQRARLTCISIKNIANNIEYDAKDYGVNFPFAYAEQLRKLADDYLKLK